MSNSILYYPTIEFQKSDYRWLWNASLLWDKIYRIVPPGFVLNEPRNIKALCESGDIGVPLSPVHYAEAASVEFSLFIDKFSRGASALCGIDSSQYDHSSRVHYTKIDEQLKRKLLYDEKIFESDDGWLLCKPEIANLYMTFLAKHISEKNSLSLYTHSRELWTTSIYYLSDGGLQADYLVGEGYSEPSVEALVSLMIEDVFPDITTNVRPEEILQFREKRKDERKQFICAINDLKSKLSYTDAPEIFREILENEKKKINQAKSDYKRSMDILKVVKFGGILTTFLICSADVLGYLPFSQSTTSIIASTGIGVNILTGFAENKLSKHKTNPYCYLASIDKRFSGYNLPNEPLFCRNSYALHQDIVEFIDD